MSITQRRSKKGTTIYGIQTEVVTHIESSDDDSFFLSKITYQQIIDCELAKGSGFQDGKQRIVDFFKKP